MLDGGGALEGKKGDRGKGAKRGGRKGVFVDPQGVFST